MKNQRSGNKGNKKVKKHRHFKSVFNKANMSEGNRMKLEKLESQEALRREESTRQLETIFSRARFLTYICLILLPPYGIYRVWYRHSTFNKTEKYLWTFVTIVFIAKLSRLIFNW